MRRFQHFHQFSHSAICGNVLCVKVAGLETRPTNDMLSSCAVRRRPNAVARCSGPVLCMTCLNRVFGYTPLQVHTDEGAAAEQDISRWVSQTFGGQLAEAPHLGRFKYTLPASQCSLAAVFRNVEAVKDALHIRAYRSAPCSVALIITAYQG